MVPYRDNGHSQQILHALGIPYLFLASFSWREQNKRLTCPGLEGEPYESESNSVSVQVRAHLDLFRIREGGRSLNQWTLMNHH